MSGITWRGNITVDGPIYEFNGTVEVSLPTMRPNLRATCLLTLACCPQEIYTQIKAANPEYKLMEVPRKHSASPHQLKVSRFRGQASVLVLVCSKASGNQLRFR